MSVADHLIHTCTVQRATKGRGSDGSVIKAWQPHLSGIACRLMITVERIARPDGSFQTVRVYTLILPAGTDVTIEDRIGLVTFEDASSAGPYTINGIMPRRAKEVRFLALDVSQVNSG